MTSWLRARYSLYAPFYDMGPTFGEERRRAIEQLELRPGERVLVAGVGTGADLPLLPDDLQVLGVDLTPAMLARAHALRRPGVELRLMNVERLQLPDASFDAALLHQVLEVVGDPLRCLRELARVLRPGGRVSVFDKFLADGAPQTPWQRAVTRARDLVFTAAKHRIDDLLTDARTPLELVGEEECRPPFRILLLRRPPAVNGHGAGHGRGAEGNGNGNGHCAGRRRGAGGSGNGRG